MKDLVREEIKRFREHCKTISDNETPKEFFEKYIPSIIDKVKSKSNLERKSK